MIQPPRLRVLLERPVPRLRIHLRRFPQELRPLTVGQLGDFGTELGETHA